MGEQYKCIKEHSYSEMHLLIGDHHSHPYSIFLKEKIFLPFYLLFEPPLSAKKAKQH